MADTPNYALHKPTVGGDTDAWGALLNENADTLDDALDSISGVADGALPKGGGTMSGTLHAKAESLAHVAVTPAAGVATCDCALGNSFSFTVGAITSIAFTNVPSTGELFPVFLEIKNGGAFATTFAVTPKTPGAAGVPTLTTAGTDIVGLTTRDGGTTWLFVGATRDVK
jgi:hypothetical protein